MFSPNVPMLLSEKAGLHQTAIFLDQNPPVVYNFLYKI